MCKGICQQGDHAIRHEANDKITGPSHDEVELVKELCKGLQAVCAGFLDELGNAANDNAKDDDGNDIRIGHGLDRIHRNQGPERIDDRLYVTHLAGAFYSA